MLPYSSLTTQVDPNHCLNVNKLVNTCHSELMDYNKVSILGHDTLLESHPAWFEHIEVLNDAFFMG